jgi:hypothetical protein
MLKVYLQSSLLVSIESRCYCGSPQLSYMGIYNTSNARSIRLEPVQLLCNKEIFVQYLMLFKKEIDSNNERTHGIFMFFLIFFVTKGTKTT